MDRDVVDAVVDQINSHGGMAIQCEGDFQLGPHAVDAGNENGIAGKGLD